VTMIVKGPALVEPTEFVADTLNVYVPAVVGVPLRAPALLSATPSGSAPSATANVGPGVPVAVNAKLYGAPTAPVAVGAPEVKPGFSPTVIWNGPATSVPAEVVAVTENVNIPALVGVPERVPSAASVIPSGSAPSPTENVGDGWPSAVSAKL